MVDVTFFYAKFINWVNFCVVIENQKKLQRCKVTKMQRGKSSHLYIFYLG